MIDSLSVSLIYWYGVQVLHMDRNKYYGGESTSLNLIQLWERFRGNDKPPAHLGPSRDYNVDMVPKFMMANGALVRVLIHTDVTKYLSFKAVDGSYVFNKGKVHKVPATDMEALKSPLMGFFEKRRARNFIVYVQSYEQNNPSTHEGLDLTRVATRALIEYASYLSLCIPLFYTEGPFGKSDISDEANHVNKGIGWMTFFVVILIVVYKEKLGNTNKGSDPVGSFPRSVSCECCPRDPLFS
ncbi:Rab GDP dissociation inhibitor alpha [Asimina triloba]